MDQTQLQAFVKNAVANMENANPSGSPYTSSVSTGNSQLSFGAMQLDVGSGNPIAVNAFTQIMNGSVGVNGKTQADINSLIDKAKTDASNLTPDQRNFIDAALAASKTIVDQADAQQLTKVMGYVNGALVAAARNPNGPGELNATAPDPQFITELAAWGNRTDGLAATDAFLATASNVSQAVYESEYLSLTLQFLTSNETVASNAQRVAAATTAALNAIGATVTSFSLAQQEANSIASTAEISSGSNSLAIYKDASGNGVGTLWSFSTPGSNTGSANLSTATNPITDSAGNVIGTALTVSDTAGGIAYVMTTLLDGSLARQTISDGTTLTTTQGGITTTMDIASGATGYADLAADLGDIASDGLALDQIVDMYNYWQSLHHGLGYTAYKLETQLAETVHLTTLWAQVAIPGASIYAKRVYDAYRAELQNADLIIDIGPLGPTVRKLISGDSVVLLTGTPLAVGSGKLIGVNTVDASGHSLGGHLAMAFSRLFPASTGNVVAVNGAGFDLNNGNVNTLFSQLNGAANDARYEAERKVA